MENKENTFQFTYSAQQQEEVKRIRQKYLPAEEDKMAQLRRLDASVTRKGQAASIALGVIGTLVMGVGMCCCLVWQGVWFIPGIIIGLVGMLLLALAYPVYNRITQKARQKLAPQILRLTDELMNGTDR